MTTGHNAPLPTNSVDLAFRLASQVSDLESAARRRRGLLEMLAVGAGLSVEQVTAGCDEELSLAVLRAFDKLRGAP